VSDLDAHALAEHQLATDKARTQRFPDLYARKLERMSASPLAFLRGGAPLFYEILAARPELLDGPSGEGWIVGDLHLENFGAYRPDALHSGEASDAPKKHAAVFSLNDFDDTVVGPWRLDVLRLMTSLLLASRELGATGLVALELSDRMFDGWASAVFDGEPPAAPPAPVAALIDQVQSRSRPELLEARTAVSGSGRRFTRGARYADLPKKLALAVPAALEQYIASVVETERPANGSVEIVDAAFRIAGTGSLGCLRIAVLVEGKGGRDGGWIFDLKEQGTPSAMELNQKKKTHVVDPFDADPAVRVVTGFRKCIEHPPRVMGTTHLDGPDGETISMVGRRLSPQEDKLNLPHLRNADLPALATYLGALLGVAHARGASKTPSTRWSKSDRDTVRTQAVTLAGIHEAVYLALCHRIRDRR
jgi:uncharacterized protein (DUF2252 family)